MNLLIKNVLIPHGETAKSTDIYISDGIIASIGEMPENFIADEVIDGNGRLAIPAFVNSHTHDYKHPFQ